MTSCKPPPTCIDASPIPDANDSRMSAIPYEANLTPMGAPPLPSVAFGCDPFHGAKKRRAVRVVQRRNRSRARINPMSTAESRNLVASDPETRRALELDTLAAILPMDRRDRLAELLTD